MLRDAGHWKSHRVTYGFPFRSCNCDYYIGALLGCQSVSHTRHAGNFNSLHFLRKIFHRPCLPTWNSVKPPIGEMIRVAVNWKKISEIAPKLRAVNFLLSTWKNVWLVLLRRTVPGAKLKKAKRNDSKGEAKKFFPFLRAFSGTRKVSYLRFPTSICTPKPSLPKALCQFEKRTRIASKFAISVRWSWILKLRIWR